MGGRDGVCGVEGRCSGHVEGGGGGGRRRDRNLGGGATGTQTPDLLVSMGSRAVLNGKRKTVPVHGFFKNDRV